jgi:hypothetical protein
MMVVRERSEGNPARDQRYEALLSGLHQGYDKHPQMPSGEAWPRPEQVDAFERGARIGHAVAAMDRAGVDMRDDLLDLLHVTPEHLLTAIATHRKAFVAARSRAIELVRFKGRTMAETYPSSRGKTNPGHNPHTEGQWKATPVGDGTFRIHTDRAHIAHVDADPETARIASHPKKNEENALFIAAAPSLLASLKELVEIGRWKLSPTDEVVLKSGRTNHDALTDAVNLLERIGEFQV